MVVDGEGGAPERRPLWLVLTADARRYGVEYVAPAGTRVRIVADPDLVTIRGFGYRFDPTPR
jgi:hypothetical protein